MIVIDWNPYSRFPSPSAHSSRDSTQKPLLERERLIPCFPLQMKTKLEKVGAKAYKKTMSKYSRKGEGDRHIAVKKPKHLYTGKRGIGKTDRR